MMNHYQRIILGIGLLLVILNGLFLPYEGQLKGAGVSYSKPLGYRFLFNPPPQAEVFRAIIGKDLTDGMQVNLCASHIVISRFVVQLVTIIVGTVGGFFLFGKRGDRACVGDSEQADTNTSAGTVMSDERDVKSSAVQPVTTPQVMIPESVANQLRDDVIDFVSGEFRASAPQVQKRAGRFVHDRVRLAAQHHFSEGQTMDGFRDAEIMRAAAAKFRDLTGTKTREA